MQVFARLKIAEEARFAQKQQLEAQRVRTIEVKAQGEHDIHTIELMLDRFKPILSDWLIISKTHFKIFLTSGCRIS